MRLRILAVAVALGSLALTAPPAAAVTVGTTSSMGKADLVHHKQRLTEILTNHLPGEVGYATYREVNADKVTSPDGQCPATMATNLSGRVFGPVTVRKPTFKASVLLNLQLYVICEYASSTGSLDPAAAALTSSALLGQYFPGGPATPTKATKVSVKSEPSGANIGLAGTATGPASGTVVVQRKSGSTWRSIASTVLQHGKFSARVAAQSGQLLRVVRLPAVGWRAGASAAVRVP